MTRFTVLAGLCFLLVAPAVAQAPPPSAYSSPDCPIYGVPESEMILAASAASQGLTDVPAPDEARSRAALDTILANVPECAEAGRWTQNQRELARNYVLMRLTREDMLRRYDAQNVDLRFIDLAVAAAQAGTPPPFDELVARLRAQGLGDGRPDSAGDVAHIYMTLVYQMAQIVSGFADPNFQLR